MSTMNDKPVFKGRLLQVFLKKVRLPNGYTCTFETIRHRGAALVVPFLAKDRIIMLRQLRPVIGSYLYELPAGTIDSGETPLACARREIVEETGYAARRFTYLGKIYPVPGYSTERITIYKAEGLKQVERHAEKDEIITCHIFTKRAIKKLFRGGTMTDAKTIAALALCGWL